MPQTSPAAGYTDGYRALGDDLRAFAAPGDELVRLATTLRSAASTVADQATAHRRLLALDWHGAAATAFTGLVAMRVQLLERLASTIGDLADSTCRRAADGAAVRAAAGWVP